MGLTRMTGSPSPREESTTAPQEECLECARQGRGLAGNSRILCPTGAAPPAMEATHPEDGMELSL